MTTAIIAAEAANERLLQQVRAIEGTSCPRCHESRICLEMVSDSTSATAIFGCGCGMRTELRESLSSLERSGYDEMGW